jgi:hypothetical protein
MEWKYPLLRNWYRGPLDPASVARARRAAQALGWRVEKSRQRYRHHNNRGGLQILDRRNIVINGVNYDMTPKEVVEFCGEFAEYIELIVQGDH